MKISDALTKTERFQLVNTATEKLTILVKHPRRGELLKELELGRRRINEKKIGGIFFAKFDGENGYLFVSGEGVQEKIVSRKGYHYTGDGIVGYWEEGGTTSISVRAVEESEFQAMAEKYDLDPQRVEKVIERIGA